MKFKEIIKRKSFWVAVSGAVLLLAQILGLRIEAPAVNEIITAICSILMLVGVITLKDKEEIESELKKEENKVGLDKESLDKPPTNSDKKQ